MREWVEEFVKRRETRREIEREETKDELLTGLLSVSLCLFILHVFSSDLFRFTTSFLLSS